MRVPRVETITQQRLLPAANLSARLDDGSMQSTKSEVRAGALIDASVAPAAGFVRAEEL